MGEGKSPLVKAGGGAPPPPLAVDTLRRRTGLSLLLSGLMNAAEQLPATEHWRLIWHRIFEPYRLSQPVPLAPSG